jgi:hypothetical protein
MMGAWNSLITLKFNKWASVIFLLTLGLYVAARAWNLTTTPLNFDETFSVHAVRHDWSGLIHFLERDMVHPPLFYVLLKVWVEVGGESLLWLRLFGLLMATISIFPLIGLCRQLNLSAVEQNLAVGLIAVNGFLIYYSQFLRMYGLLLFLSLCSLWLFVRLIKSRVASWALLWSLFFVNLMLVFTHYFGWFLLGSEFIYLSGYEVGRRFVSGVSSSNVLSRFAPARENHDSKGTWTTQRFWFFLASLVAILLCFSPWIYIVARVYSDRGLHDNLSWMESPQIRSVADFFAELNGDPLNFGRSGRLGLLLYGGPIILWGCQIFLVSRGRLKQETSTFSLLFVFGFLPVFLVFASRFWLPRALILVSVPYLILVVVALNRLRPRWVSIAALSLVLAWGIIAGFQTLTSGFSCDVCPRPLHEDIRMDSWARQIAQSESAATNDVKVYAFDSQTAYITWFHLSGNVKSVEVVVVGTIGPNWLAREMFKSVAVNDLTALEGDQFWVAVDDNLWRQQRTPKELFKDAGYHVGTGFEGGPEGKKTRIFPVWRPAKTARPFGDDRQVEN